MSSTREAVIAACDAYIAAMSVGDPTATVALFAPDASHEEPAGTPVRHGHDEIFGFLDQYKDIGFKLTRLGPVTVVGNRGAFQIGVDVPTPDGIRSIAATDIITVSDDGLISGIVVFPDSQADPTEGR
ncbi:SnoaL-like domain-containing protein [Nocardioides sp. JQ2195]|uniref:nuclear transport factor 2 family protein n=1 Tax=Nocardioides sp. JQ2195 TaxID=2592334 RepID=UPI00143E3A8E|nr:nuclear transport factor 2 family protein [Nocardioides sp. JQ2195]QIX26496.1 SnoaL-like domain-containing protein [Nocardioides sp. JQ2195]